jgi:putative copper export protein
MIGFRDEGVVILDITDPAKPVRIGTYVGLLAVKLILFCLMLVLAAVNRVKLVPRVAASNHRSAAMQLWWSILAELALGLVILLAVGALGITPLGTDE